MHILYVHKNFPAQFGHIAERLSEEYGCECTFVSELPSEQIGRIRRIQYQADGGATASTHYTSRTFENYVWHSHGVYNCLKQHEDVQPDLIVGHSGFGSTVFLRELYDCPIVNYFEYYYRTGNSELDFRSSEADELDRLRIHIRNGMLLLDLQICDAGYAPTEWQKSRFPMEYQNKLHTIHDGIDTRTWNRTASAGPRQVAGRTIPPGTRIVTYCSRGFESMRGFDVFMKVAHRICAVRKDVVFVCVGSDRVCYGSDMRHITEGSFREHVLAQNDFDLDRFIFTGNVTRPELARIFNLSDLHIYLTVPFVLSWSMLNALACGCTLLASDTEPVREIIRHNENGRLCGFFDTDRFVENALEILNDPEEFRFLGRSGIETIRSRYSLETTLPRMIQLYESVADGGVRSDRSESPKPVIISGPASRLSGLMQPRDRNLKPDRCPDRSTDKTGPRGRPFPLEKLSDRSRLLLFAGVPRGTVARRTLELAPDCQIALLTDSRPVNELDDNRQHSQWLDQFWYHCWADHDRILPFSGPAPAALKRIAHAGLAPDLIYAVCDLSPFESLVTLNLASYLFPRAVLAGNYCRDEDFRQSLSKLAEERRCEFQVRGNYWRLEPEQT